MSEAAMTLPRVACIMPVLAQHARFIPGALECFAEQRLVDATLFVHANYDVFMAAWDELKYDVRLMRSGLDGSRVVFTSGEPGDVVAARNGLCKQVCEDLYGPPDYIAHWDVDDWSHPERLSRQTEMMRLAGPTIQVGGFRSAMFADNQNLQAWHYRGEWTTNLGSSLIYAPAWWRGHPFRHKQQGGNGVGEDARFINEAAAAGVYTSADQVHLLVCREHAWNTARRSHLGDCWRPIPFNELPAEYIEAQWAR